MDWQLGGDLQQLLITAGKWLLGAIAAGCMVSSINVPQSGKWLWSKVGKLKEKASDLSEATESGRNTDAPAPSGTAEYLELIDEITPEDCSAETRWGYAKQELPESAILKQEVARLAKGASK